MITSQNNTAPKHRSSSLAPILCLITSQNDTAPKHKVEHELYPEVIQMIAEGRVSVEAGYVYARPVGV
ncbi:hypothetical protein [Lancefieldella parvula]|uniref:hypothetical protein n=1 Tax=Lancefieldella parvula TaxID=1382 RepID=UPI00288BF0B4|nr:hypothetical protein [Lancefieldella parvula]